MADENFLAAAEGRTRRAVKNIELISDLFENKKYHVEEDDIKKIKHSIEDALDILEVKFKNHNIWKK
ncbi:MAG: hypothetical protein VW683_02695 [Betaproteobacteria bacterium]